ncbi:MAG: hypothetical protein A3C06_02290 [Candidatus Taylorbacteria bacterium RIFCSPHIGHO2_02_FULL_46_13]|uniref:Uncharacterized protein n=1 Tax=Candidatus Taylorbacteria bacterium RIFCSPHIGHO2_02_FULL_46_13 TaxID=1802312 RepID=A0A1G2MUK3_9BACT|nr:MAG: hypothetical protein A3C06_02290 [Candidatus Taylorbacteria bacterium RIFCSPHIGHO2_02_FULL_46_13]
MRVELGFARKTRVVKVKGHGKGRTGLVTEVNHMSGTWRILWDDTKLNELANPHEFETRKNGSDQK